MRLRRAARRSRRGGGLSRIVDTIRTPAQADGEPRPSGPRRRGNPIVGAVQYFHLHDRETVEQVLEGLERLPIAHLRTAISWCDWMSEGGEEWYRWLLPRLTERFEVLPCFLYTPPALGILPKTSSPPRDPQDYGEFVEMVLRRHDGDFTHVELWNEPNNYIEWDWTIDPEWKIFAEMIGGAARRVSELGVKPVLGGMSPFDPNWLDLMFKRGALEHVDVIGVHGFPGTWEAVWDGWDRHIDRVQEVVDRHASPARLWITEAGFSTWAHDELRQLTTMVELADAPAERVYWYSVQDLAPERETLDGFHCDERAYHFGLQRRSGQAKLLARVLADGGLEAVREMVEFCESSRGGSERRVLVTGGAGFVGTNLADRLASEGRHVTVLDNLVRPGAEANVRWLKEAHGDLLRVEVGDVRDVFAIRRCLADCDGVFHLAASAPDAGAAAPVDDLDVNVRGTVNLLEEARRLDRPPAIVFASTSAVYAPDDSGRLGFTTPFGCSKGAADQYVLEYARGFGLAACVLRIGCAYGRRQTGREEQAWVGELVLGAVERRAVTIPGDGAQVRDPLHVDDLVDALIQALGDERCLTGRAFDVGGGEANAVSLAEAVTLVEELAGTRLEVRSEVAALPGATPSRYVSDFSAFTELTGWAPRVPLPEGLARMLRWAAEERAEPARPDGARSASPSAAA